MAEGDLEGGRIPGADQKGTVAADGLVFHPDGRWGVEIIRMLGAGVVHDLDAPDYRPITLLSFNGDTPDQAPVEEVDPGRVWTVRVDRVVPLFPGAVTRRVSAPKERFIPEDER